MRDLSATYLGPEGYLVRLILGKTYREKTKARKLLVTESYI